MFIIDNPLAKLIIQDIINVNSTKAAELSFNTLFDIENIANFYVIVSSFF